MSFDVLFLAADKPIVKRYEITPNTGELVKHPYPFVYEVTSYQETCTNLHDLFQHIQKYAKQGDCMVKGKLGRQLVTESRKGTTNPEELTEWICLDLDGIEGYQSVDHFLSDIGCAETDYILQWSSSMGIENKAGFRCHIFMQLDKPVRPQQLKNWLQDLNLSRPTLSGQLQLTKTGNSLRWPLDITTCQNDKLLYIAPPDLGKGITDPFPEKGLRGKPASPRITFEQRVHKKLTLPTNLILQEALRDRTHAKVSELRVAAGLPKMKAVKYKFDGTIEYMANPGQATITDMKEERGFVYFNLNGGDSWAYYHPSESPEFIYNFKGEPTYRTQDLLPQYWAKLTQQAASGAPDAKGNIYLAFREFTSGVYWNGIYDTVNDKLELYPAKSETQLRHFMKNNKMPLGESIPDWKRVFEPNNPNVIDRQAQTVNIYNPSDFFKDLQPAPVASPPPVINKIIDHVLGNDMATLDHFYNWLAVIVQHKTRAGTAWVLQGTQGCLAGDVVLQFATPTKRLRPSTVKQAFEKWNGVTARGPHAGKGWNVSKGLRTKSVRDGLTIGYHDIFKIVESGVKPLFKVTTDSGESIRVTGEHPFMRGDKTFTPLNQLKVGNEVLMEGPPLNAPTGKKIRAKSTRRVTHSVPYHPSAWDHTINGKNYKRINTARLVVEADMNGMSVETLISILRTDAVKASSLKFLPKNVVVHHADEDLSNEDLSNLVVIDKANHDAHHAKETGLGTISTRLAKIVSIEAQNEEMTYDLVMKAPYHNYVANGFIVSNTGKGLLMHNILTPLFGYENVAAKRMEELESQFTEFMENKFIVFIDEIEAGKSLYHAKVTAKLKNLIVEPMISIRNMYRPAYLAPNFASMIFASNKPSSVEVAPDDRRFNVGVYQENKLQITGPEIDQIDQELDEFYAYLMHYPADPDRARTPLISQSRSTLIDISRTAIDTISDALLKGDLQTLWDHLPSQKSLTPGNALIQTKSQGYRDLIVDVVSNIGNHDKLTRDELYTIFEYTVGNMPTSPNKLTSTLKHHRLHLKPVWKYNRSVRGIEVNWKVDPAWLAQAQQEIASGAV